MMRGCVDAADVDLLLLQPSVVSADQGSQSAVLSLVVQEMTKYRVRFKAKLRKGISFFDFFMLFKYHYRKSYQYQLLSFFLLIFFCFSIHLLFISLIQTRLHTLHLIIENETRSLIYLLLLSLKDCVNYGGIMLN